MRPKEDYLGAHPLKRALIAVAYFFIGVWNGIVGFFTALPGMGLGLGSGSHHGGDHPDRLQLRVMELDLRLYAGSDSPGGDGLGILHDGGGQLSPGRNHGCV